MSIVKYTAERLNFISKEIERCHDEERKKSLEVIMQNIVKFMSDHFKNINGREVRTIGYDPKNKICVIEYNHFNNKSASTYYYEDVQQWEFDVLIKSTSVAIDAEELFKNKSFKN